MPHLSALSLALNRPGAVSLEQVVASLFAAGEQGAWYDPSAANVTWRRNLLTYTEQFDNAAWQKLAANTGVVPVVTANAGTAPDGTTTADRVVLDRGAGTASGDVSRLFQSATAPASGTSVFSVWMRSYDGSSSYTVRLVCGNGTSNVTVTPTWTRFSVVSTDTSTNAQIRLQGDQTQQTADILAWGAHINYGTTATAYQRIVTPEITYLADVQSQPLLFQDSTGATPVTAVEQPVGLILDKRKGLVLGPELVTGAASAYPNSTIATVGDTVTATCSTNGTYGIRWATGAVATAGWVKMTVEIVTNGAARSVVLFPNLINAGVNVGTTVGNKVCHTLVAATSGSNADTAILIQGGVAGETFSVRLASVKYLDGNHAYQTTSAARPVLRARYNLFTYSEQVATTWQNTNITVASNDAVAPDGTTTADLVSNNDTGTTSFYFFQQGPTIVQNTTYTMSIYAKKKTGSGWVYIIGNATTDILAWFNLDTGTKGTTTGWDNTTIDPVPNMAGWYRITGTFTNTAATNAQNIGFFLTNANGVQNFNSTGLGNSQQVWFWGADLRVGTSAGDYQRIAAATDYATTSTITGQPFRPYLNFDAADGTADSLFTASVDFSASDKAAIIAGITKQSTAVAVAVELSTGFFSNAGTFGLFTDNVASSYTPALRGATNQSSVECTTYVSPHTAVVSVQYDISQSLTLDAIKSRINAATGTQTPAAVNANLGGGNWGNYPLFIGRRNNSTLPFSGRMFGLIIRNGLSSAGQIAAAESYMAGKTGVTL